MILIRFPRISPLRLNLIEQKSKGNGLDLLFAFTSIFDLLSRLRQQKTHFCLVTKVRFLNDVCLWQMMLATAVMTASPNDVCLRAHRGKHRIIAERSGATSYLRSKCIISPQGDASFDK